MTEAKYDTFSVIMSAKEGSERRDYEEAVGPPETPKPDD